MATKDIQSNLQPQLALLATIGTNTTTNGSVVDTANFDLGYMFTAAATAFTDGVYDVQVFESDDSGMAGATQITGDKLLGGISSISAANSQADVLESLGVFANKRFLQVRIVSTAVTTGATLVGTVVQKAEILPAA